MSSDGHYVLDGQEPRLEPDLYTWARWFETADRKVARDTVDGVTISTVFLGLDHSWDGPPPLLFETLVVEGPRDGDMYRYATWAEAAEGHSRVVAEIRGEAS